MPASTRFATGFGVAFLLFNFPSSSFTPSASGQTDSPPRGLRGASLTVESLEEQIRAVKEDSSLDDAAKATITSTLEEGVANLRSAAELDAQTAALKTDFDQGPNEIKAVRSELTNRQSGKPPGGATVSADLPSDASSEMIGARLTSEKTRITEMTRQIRAMEGQITELGGRPSANRERIIEVTRLLSEAETAISKWTAQSAASPQDQANHLSDQARIKALRAELAALEQEALTLDVKRQLTEARRDLASSDLALIRERVRKLESRTGALVNASISEAERLVSELGVEAISNHPPLKSLVEETRKLALNNQLILQRNTTANASLKDAEEKLERLQRDAENIRAQIEIKGLASTFSEVFLQIRRELPTQQSFREDATERHQIASGARLEAFQMERELDSLRSTEDQLEKLIQSIDSEDLPKETLAKLRPVLKSLIETRFRLLKDASDGNRKLAGTLGEVEIVENKTLSVSAEFRTYLGENLIWVASSPPLGFDSFRGLKTAFVSLLGSEALREYGAAIARIPSSKWVLAVLLSVALLLPRRGLRRYLAASAARTRRIDEDRIGNTLGAVAAVLCLALPIPTFLWFFGWVLTTDPLSTPTTLALGRGLIAPSFLLLVFRFFAILCWPGGVAETHFRWNRVMIGSIHRALMTAVFLYLPAHILLTIWFNGKDFSAFQGPGRLVFIMAMLSVAMILRGLLRRSGGFLVTLDPSLSWLVKLRRFWTAGLILLPMVLAILAALGHFLTAVALAFQLVNTALVILGGVLAYGLLRRWMLMKGRRIALLNSQSQEGERATSRKATLHESESSDSPLSAGTMVPLEEDEPVDWVTVGQQNRNLIRAVVTLAVIFGCWLVWSEVIPVLKYLDARNLIGQISISDLIWLTMLAVVTNVVTQNLPGLLEVTFLQALDLESGLRNAIITICQYAVIGLGVAFALNTIGWDAAQFGWIAAALSVGLGFGLQEVVANFVCGLILLFERPIRVGDFVTVAGIDGVVSKIQIRATTITNLDRKEFIVPNKEFVTGTLLNWTLSTPMIRLVLPIGIAYGSDIKKAQETLVAVALDDPEVLADPPPLAILEQFGDSSLNFTLRIFIARPENRFQISHRVNTEIHNRFSKVGIEIPFPQRDLHIRSMDPSISFGESSHRRE